MTIQELISAPRCGCDRADVGKGLWPVDDALTQAFSLIEPMMDIEFFNPASASGRVWRRISDAGQWPQGHRSRPSHAFWPYYVTSGC